jgi:POT family proton-dependent oligopeptide transporter
MIPDDIEGALGAKRPPVYTKPAADESVIAHYDGESDIQTPTEEELHSLRRVSEKIPWSIYTVAFVELVARFSFYGTTVVCK